MLWHYAIVVSRWLAARISKCCHMLSVSYIVAIPLYDVVKPDNITIGSRLDLYKSVRKV